MKDVMRVYASAVGTYHEVADKVTEELIGMYISFLVAIGFMAKPVVGKGKPMPKVDISTLSS